MAKTSGGSSRRLAEGITTGLVGAAVTGAAIAAYGVRRTGSAWAPFNALTEIFFGEQAMRKDDFSPRETLTGIALMGAALTTWGTLYESAAGDVPLPQSLVTGALGAGAVYALDYHIFPPVLRPGFEKRIGNDSVGIVFALLALCFGLSPLWKKGANR